MGVGGNGICFKQMIREGLCQEYHLPSKWLHGFEIFSGGDENVELDRGG